MYRGSVQRKPKEDTRNTTALAPKNAMHSHNIYKTKFSQK